MICEEDCPENREDLKLTTMEGEVYWIRSHHACESNLIYDPVEPDMIYEEVHSYNADREMMRLSVLRSCRQIYVEANNILWTTNTFSFADGTTLKRFMMTRTINQKRAIESLRLEMERVSHEREWNQALNMALVRSLSGLRRLRLHIEYEINLEVYEVVKKCDLYATTFLEGLKKLSTLPLTEVEIDVKISPFVPEDNLWTKLDRQDFAEGFRKVLLNPKGAQIYEERQLKLKEQSRKEREYFAKIKASMSRPRLQAEAESMVHSPLAGPSV